MKNLIFLLFFLPVLCFANDEDKIAEKYKDYKYFIHPLNKVIFQLGQKIGYMPEKNPLVQEAFENILMARAYLVYALELEIAERAPFMDYLPSEKEFEKP